MEKFKNLFLFFLFIITVKANPPIVYHSRYDITLETDPIVFMHSQNSFDSSKYSKTVEYLERNSQLKSSDFMQPEQVTEEDLKLVHSEEYLESLTPQEVANIVNTPCVAYCCPDFIKENLIVPMKYATGGTILATRLALEKKWAINLSGGYHHAKANEGGGFCVFADIPIAIRKIWEKNPKYRILIVDLDAHQGNGNEDIFYDDNRVEFFDVYNSNKYPKDRELIKKIKYHYPLESANDKEYLNILEDLDKAIQETKPNLIMYNAGTDILKGDPLGGFDVSEKGVIARDSIVFEKSLKNNIPICMLLSGGYTSDSYSVIGKSIKNLWENVIGNYLPEYRQESFISSILKFFSKK